MYTNLFPNEILVEILCRLPSKSLVRFAMVCKSWHSLITSQSFISLHHCHSPSSLFLMSNNHLTLLDCSRSSNLSLPTYPPSGYVAFCNGLLCVAYDAQCHGIVICNPSVRRIVYLPTLSENYPWYYNSHIGFGFDSTNRDYKVVRISCMLDDARFGLSAPEVDLYSLATGYWRGIAGIAPVCSIVGDASYGFHDGIVHWVARRCLPDGWCYFILSFNFEREVFSEIMLPESLARASYDAVMISVVGGGNEETLTVYRASIGSPCTCDIWVMKEYGVMESWNKVFSFNMTGFSLEVPSLGILLLDVAYPPFALRVTDNEEVLMLMNVAGIRRFYSLNVERKSFTELQNEVDEGYIHSGYYSESLLLLNEASGAWPY